MSREKATLKEFWIHFKFWLLQCPIFDEHIHTYVGSLDDDEFECLSCGRKKYEKRDEDEIEFNKKLQESLAWMDEE